jgi:hypothetical protein
VALAALLATALAGAAAAVCDGAIAAQLARSRAKSTAERAELGCAKSLTASGDTEKPAFAATSVILLSSTGAGDATGAGVGAGAAAATKEKVALLCPKEKPALFPLGPKARDSPRAAPPPDPNVNGKAAEPVRVGACCKDARKACPSNVNGEVSEEAAAGAAPPAAPNANGKAADLMLAAGATGTAESVLGAATKAKPLEAAPPPERGTDKNGAAAAADAAMELLAEVFDVASQAVASQAVGVWALPETSSMFASRTLTISPVPSSRTA